MEIIQNYIKEDLYEILGVKNDTSLSEIKSRYKKLSIKFHPDKYITRTELSSEEKKTLQAHFNLINIAYKILSSEDTRKQYDKSRKEYLDAGQIFDLMKQFDNFENFTYGDEGTAKKTFAEENDKINVDNEKVAEDIRINTMKNLNKKFEVAANPDLDLFRNNTKAKEEYMSKFNDLFDTFRPKGNQNTEIMAYNGDDNVSTFDAAFQILDVSHKDFKDNNMSLDERMNLYKKDFEESTKNPKKKK